MRASLRRLAGLSTDYRVYPGHGMDTTLAEEKRYNPLSTIIEVLMKLTLHGHDDRYAVEQLQLSLFPVNTEGEAVSSLHGERSGLPQPRKSP